MLRYLIVLGATLLCFHIAPIDSKSSESSEENLNDRGASSSLPGVGVIAQPILQAITVQQPGLRDHLAIRDLVTQLLAQRDVENRSRRGGGSEEKRDSEEKEDSEEKRDSEEEDGSEEERGSKEDRGSEEKSDSGEKRKRDEEDSKERKVARDIKDARTSPVCLLFGRYGP